MLVGSPSQMAGKGLVLDVDLDPDCLPLWPPGLSASSDLPDCG